MGRGDSGAVALWKPGFISRRAIDRQPQREGERRYAIEAIGEDRSSDPPKSFVIRNPSAVQDRALFDGYMIAKGMRIIEEVAIKDREGQLSWQRSRQVEWPGDYQTTPRVSRLYSSIEYLNSHPLEQRVIRRRTAEGQVEIGLAEPVFDQDLFSVKNKRIPERERELKCFDPIREAEAARTYHRQIEREVLAGNLRQIEEARAQMRAVEAEREREQRRQARDKREGLVRDQAAADLLASLDEEQKTVGDYLAAERQTSSERRRRVLGGLG